MAPLRGCLVTTTWPSAFFIATSVHEETANCRLQVLYSLPELDGAIDTVPLGGLVKDDIYIIPERVSRLLARVRKWTALRRKAPAERRVAVLLYGFPPGVGATGTAALLNVPASLERTLGALRDAVRRPSPPTSSPRSSCVYYLLPISIPIVIGVTRSAHRLC